MNILIKPRKNRYIIYAIIIALFSTIGMQISLLNINIEQIFKRLEYRSMLMQNMRKCMILNIYFFYVH